MKRRLKRNVSSHGFAYEKSLSCFSAMMTLCTWMSWAFYCKQLLEISFFIFGKVTQEVFYLLFIFSPCTDSDLIFCYWFQLVQNKWKLVFERYVATKSEIDKLFKKIYCFTLNSLSFEHPCWEFLVWFHHMLTVTGHPE